MHVSIITPYLSPGTLPGIDREVVRLAKHLATRGDSVVVITTDRAFPNGWASGRPDELDSRVELLRLSGHLRAHLRHIQPSHAPLVVRGLADQARGSDVAVVFNAGWPVTLRLAGFGGRRWPPVLYRTYWHPTRGRLSTLNWVRNVVAAGTFKRACLLSAASAAEARVLRKMVGTRALVQVLAPGVDQPPRNMRDREAIRNELGALSGTLLAVQVGRPGRFKGTDKAIEAVAVARREGMDARLLIVGDPVDGEWLDRIVTVNCAESWATVTGVVDDRRKFELLRASDALLLVSEFEGFGYTAFEAMVCGTDAIAFTDLSAAPLLAEYGAVLVERSSGPWAIAEALKDVHTRASSRCGMPRQIPTWEAFGDRIRERLLVLTGEPPDGT